MFSIGERIDEGDGPDPSAVGLSGIRPIRRAYEQVAEQLRAMILSGEVAMGQRLPVESTLAREFGVSRTTMREALRALGAQNLIRTTKGPNGGNFITFPTVDHLATSVGSTLTVLAEAHAVELVELLEARELLETRAARLAAERRSEQDIERLRASIPTEPRTVAPRAHFESNWNFHVELLSAAGNSLLYLAAQPMFMVLQSHLEAARRQRRVYDTINGHHREIADAIEASDGDAAERLMHEHLAYLTPLYEHEWPHTRT